MVEAARKYNRIVAVGTQSRSNTAIQAAIKFLHEGGIGELHTARGLRLQTARHHRQEGRQRLPAGCHTICGWAGWHEAEEYCDIRLLIAFFTTKSVESGGCRCTTKW